MRLQSSDRVIKVALVLCAFLTTLTITPFANYEAVVLPKFVILIVFAISILPIIVFGGEFKKVRNSAFIVLSLAFIFTMIVTSIFSSTNTSTLIYGVVGRNTGILTYISLTILSLAAYLYSNIDFGKQILIALIITGIVNCIYGLMQYVGFDFAQWANPFSPIVTTLGNPNFASAHLSISAIACLPFILHGKSPFTLRLLLSLQSLCSLFLMYKSNSAQGYLIYILLAPIIFILNFKKFLALKVKTFVWMAYFASLSLGILGIFGLGPLSNLLFQNSFMHRIDMWKIAFRIFLDFPLVGVGMDSYSFWYRTYRDSNQTSRWGELTVSDASHNLFLDFATSGGLILVGISVLMLFVIGKSSVKLLKNVKGVEPITFSLVFSAGAFFLQAMVSINQIALAVWGYLLAGCVVGMTRSNSINSGLNVIQRVPGIERKYKYTTQVIVASLLSLALALPPFLKDLHFRKAINNQNAVELVDAVNTFPFTDEYYRLGATLLLQNDLFDLSASLAKRGLGFFPRSIELYRLLISNKSVSAVDKANFTQKIIEIDKNINQ